MNTKGGFAIFIILLCIFFGFFLTCKDIALNSISSDNMLPFISFALMVFVYIAFLVNYANLFGKTLHIDPKRKQRKVRFDYRECWILEEIAHEQERSDLELGARQNIVKKLRDNGYLHRQRESLTKKGKEFLKEALDSSYEENKTALAYIEIFSGIIIVLFAFLLGNQSPCPSSLQIYVLVWLLLIIILSFLGGFAYWHGCSAEHGYVELRIYNALGDSLMLFCSWMSLSILWIVFFCAHMEWHTSEIAMVFFAISFLTTTSLVIWTIRNNLSEKGDSGTLGEVIRDMINLSTNVFRNGKWRIEKSHIVPYSSVGLGLMFFSISICGSIIPIILVKMT